MFRSSREDVKQVFIHKFYASHKFLLNIYGMAYNMENFLL